MPQSFRAEVAFCVRPYKIFQYETEINNLLNPNTEIEELIRKKNEQVQSFLLKIKSFNHYFELLKEKEEEYSVGIITCLIIDEKFDLAIQKINEYRRNKISSGFRFGMKDYFDLAESFIIETKGTLKENT